MTAAKDAQVVCPICPACRWPDVCVKFGVCKLEADRAAKVKASPPSSGGEVAPVKNEIAIWTVELNCRCPKCDDYVNLLDAADFWDGRQLDVPEHHTERSNNLEVVCPACDHEFLVDCDY